MALQVIITIIAIVLSDEVILCSFNGETCLSCLNDFMKKFRVIISSSLLRYCSMFKLGFVLIKSFRCYLS